MKIRNHLKTVLAVICVLALFAGFVPSLAFAAEADLESIYRQVAEAQAQAAAQAKQAQEAIAQAQAQAQEQLQEMQQFDVEEAFKHLSSLKTGEEKEKYFLSLTEYQQALLLQYITKLAAAGEFHGFDDFDLPIDLLHQDEETAEAETAEPVETPEAEAADEEAAESPAETSAPAPVEAPVAVEEKEEKSFLHGFFDFLFGKSSSDKMEAPAPSEEPAPEELAEEAESSEPSEDDSAPVEEAPADEAPAEEASVAEAPAADEAALSPEAETLPEEPVADETLPEEPVAEEVLPAEEPASEPEEVRPTEEEMFYADYEHYINLYREFGSYADLSGVSYDVQQRIKALVDGPAEEDPVETPDVANEAIEASEPKISELEEAAEPEAVSESEAAVEPAEASAPAEAEYASASSEVLASSSAVPASPKAVSIISSLTETVALGDPVVLTGVLEDADHYADIRYIWEVDKGSGVFEPVDGAEGPVYSFPATVESLRWNWRLTVLYR